MTLNGDTDQQQPAKRSRTTTACQNCRVKKLSCSGSRPCIRCRQGRECADVALSERTPLTRRRMTELEDRIEDYERIWSALFPHLPLDKVRDRLANTGLDTTIQEIRTQGNLASLSPPSQHETPARNEPTTSPTPSRTSLSHRRALLAYPPTRPTSPHAESVRIPFNLHDAPHDASNAWNEDNTPRDGLSGLSGTSIAEKDTAVATTSNDFGTGVRAGVGYIGLSSAATMLRAIQKFTPEEHLSSTKRSDEEPESTVPLTTGNLSKLSRPSLLQGDDGIGAPTLPPYSEIGPFVDSYFKYFHTLTPIVHEPTIRAQITGALPLPTGCGSRVLFNMIFATGAFDYALDDDLYTHELKYYEEARTALQQDLLEGGSLMLVQGLALMAIWLQRSNKPNAGYICLGLAIRMAIALGAHVSTPSSNDSGLTVLESEMRNRIWWGLVTLEGGQCMTYGRPHGINLPSLAAVRIPVNTDDGCLTVSTSQVPADVKRVTLYTALITQAKLAQIAFHSWDRVSRSLPRPTAEQIKWCGDQFRDQLAALPAYMQRGALGPYRFARAVQIWRCRDYRSILYRPVLLSAAWNTSGLAVSDETVQEIIHTCRSLAMENLQDIADFRRTDPDPHRGCEWYTLYFGIQASLTILLSIVWEPRHPSAVSWRSIIQETIIWFRQLGSMKELGMSYAQIMENALAARPDANTEVSADIAGPFVQHAEHPTADIERFDFERYFSEIWDGQAQFAGMTGDLSLGMVPDVWDDMVTGMGGG